MQREQIIFHREGRIVGEAGADVEAVKVGALCIYRCEGPELAIEVLGILWVGSVVLSYRLHGPANVVCGDVFHYGMERDLGRIALDGDVARVLQAGFWLGWAIEPDGANRVLREDSKRVIAIVQRIGNWPGPMLAVLGAFRHGPDFVAAIVVPVRLVARI